MKYLIMLLIVVGAAATDFATGYIKAYCTDTIKSSKMRKGGLNKLGEIIVMAAACGLDIGIGKLGEYYNHTELSDIAGVITAVMVFVYIILMEIVSILENFAAINPEAAWISKIIDKLKIGKGDNDDKN